MFAGKEADLVVGLDIHIEQVPMPVPTPVPFPMPFVGQVTLSPVHVLVSFGLAPAINAAFDTPPSGPVLVNGAHAAKTGDLAKNAQTLPHTPMPPGTSWMPIPKAPKPAPKPPPPPPDSPSQPPGDAVLMTGSQTVYFEQCNATRLGTTAMSCSDPVRLPSSNLLATPKGQPVLVGGPPAFDATSAASAFFLRNRWTVDALQDVAFAVSPGPRARNLLSTEACELTGHPVDVATGRLVTSAEDARLEGPLPIVFTRFYSSAWCERSSTLGYGWSHSFDERIWLERGKVVYKRGDGREIEFQCVDLPGRRVRVGDELFYPIDRLWLTRTDDGFRVRSADGLVRTFAPVGRNQGDGDRDFLLLRIEDREKNTVTLRYDADRLLERIETGDRWLRLEYAAGFLRRLVAPAPEGDGWYDRATFEYSPAGDLVRAIDAQQAARTYLYDAHLLVQETDRDGVAFYFEYDGRDAEASCVRTWGDDGQGSLRLYFREITYDKKNRVTFVENSFGHVTTYKANVLNAVEEILDPHGASTKYEYDAHLWRTAEIDPLGHATRREYDARGNETKRLLPGGGAYAFRYDGDDRLVEMTDPRGGRWLWRYGDPFAWAGGETRLLEHRTPASLTHYRYDRTTTRVEVDGRAFLYERDASGRLARITYPNGSVEERAYDRLGRLTKVRDGLGRAWRIAYDWESRIAQIDEPGGIARRYRYSAEGDLVEYSDPSRVVSYGYRGNHKIAWREEGGAKLEYRYTSEDDLVVVVDEAGSIYSLTRDACRRIVEEVGFDGRKRVFLRDEAGRVKTAYTPGKKGQHFSYDAGGRLAGVKYGDGTTETFTYDPLGALVTATNAAGTVRFARDDAGRIVRESFGDDWVATHYERDARAQVATSRGLLQKIERDAMNDARAVVVLSRGPDEAVRPSWSVELERDEGGREIGRTMPGGVSTRMTYGEAGQVASLIVTRGRDVVAQSRFGWEGDGKLVAKWTAGHGNTSYEHDARNRLVSARRANGAVQYRAPDAVGNVFKREDHSDRRYGRAGLLREADGERFSYDPDGNLIGRSAPDGAKRTYGWNANGTLATVRREDGTEVSFRYDALARRIEKTSPEGSTRTIWDRNVPVHEISGADGGPARTQTWLFEPDRFAPLAKLASSGSKLAVMTDPLGTPTEMFDETGALAWRAQLDIYGVADVTIGKREDCPWRWPGQLDDADVALSYNRRRYYAPDLGSYLSEDPIRLRGGTRLYGYAGDPLVERDVFGLALSSLAPSNAVPAPPLPTADVPSSPPLSPLPPGATPTPGATAALPYGEPTDAAPTAPGTEPDGSPTPTASTSSCQ